MAEITLKRLEGFRADRRRAYRVYIDSQNVGSLKPGDAKVFEVAPGKHELQLKVDWASSERLQVDVDGQAPARFVCKPRIVDNKINLKVGFRALYFATLGFKRYIDLEREEQGAVLAH